MVYCFKNCETCHCICWLHKSIFCAVRLLRIQYIIICWC